MTQKELAMTTSTGDSSRRIEHSFFKAADAPTAGRRFAHRVALLAALAAMPCIGLAHEMEPPLEATPAMAAMRYCQTQGVRAAWGAQARFLGAPATFKYIPEAPLKKMFMGDVADVRGDAIYVLDELDLDQRRDYEESAFYGWKQADRWVAEGRERPDYEVLVAVFYQSCEQKLTKE
jgi:hypothetical protein